MGFLKNLSSGIEQSSVDIFSKSSPKEAAVAGIGLRCPHCGGTVFQQGKSMLNAGGMAALDVELINRTVTVFRCCTCGRLEWFDTSVSDS